MNKCVASVAAVIGLSFTIFTKAATAGTVSGCEFTGAVGSPSVNNSSDAYASWDLGEFDPTVPDGTVLSWSFAKIVQQNDVARVACDSEIGPTTYSGMGAVGPYNTYASGVSGIGVRLRHTNGDRTFPYTRYVSGYYMQLNALQNAVIELVKTGPITAQGTMTGQIGQFTIDNRNLVAARLYISGSIQIKPLVPTCSVQTKSVNVSMKTASVQNFTGVGSTTAEKPFEIKLNCAGGTQGATTRMFMAITDVTNTANRSTTLSLSKDSTAKGIGYQIVRQTDGSLVSYSPDLQGQDPGQWFVGQYGNQVVSVPLVARYVQTQQTVTTGSANALATFTVSYR